MFWFKGILIGLDNVTDCFRGRLPFRLWGANNCTKVGGALQCMTNR